MNVYICKDVHVHKLVYVSVISCVTCTHTLKNTVMVGPDKPAIPGQRLFRAC